MDRRTSVALIGAPTDVGAGTRGASMGPEALRVARIGPRLEARGLGAIDGGNLSGPANPWLPPVDGHRHLDEVVFWCRAVHGAVLQALEAGHLPILLGGDHSLAMGSIAAAAQHCRALRRPLRVLWLDSHADFNTARLTPTGNLHGMPVACLCGHGPRPLVELAGRVPALTPTELRQIGARCVDEGEHHFVHQAGLEIYDMRFIDEVGMGRTMELALSGLEPGAHLHVSFDLDFLDPEIAPGVGTPVRGGPSYREAQLCMEMIADCGALASLDLVEVNPSLDERNRTAEVAVEMVESLFGKSTLMRRRQ
jgi:arginase